MNDCILLGGGIFIYENAPPISLNDNQTLTIFFKFMLKIKVPIFITDFQIQNYISIRV